MLTKEELNKLCKLARLDAEQENLEELSVHFEKMIGHMDALGQMDLSQVELVNESENSQSGMREDVVTESISLEKAFMNTDSEDQRHFTIPKVIG
jgi:aspartyl-tRNA(Asn)/glutamyl-tRNA(Gln) amidotransferase subunit C